MAKMGIEEKIERLETEVQKLKDIHEIQQVWNRYTWVLNHLQLEKVLECFALKTPGARVEILGWGVWDGAEGIRKCYLVFHKEILKVYADFYRETTGKEPVGVPGFMATFFDTDPVIEVAGDGKTAKGVWNTFGHETRPFKGKMQANWYHLKRACDFAKEDGKWKMWHYHVYGMIYTPYDKSWVEVADRPEPPGSEVEYSHFHTKPDRPATHPVWLYSPTKTVEYVPACPEPYETFDEKTAY